MVVGVLFAIAVVTIVYAASQLVKLPKVAPAPLPPNSASAGSHALSPAAVVAATASAAALPRPGMGSSPLRTAYTLSDGGSSSPHPPPPQTARDLARAASPLGLLDATALKVFEPHARGNSDGDTPTMPVTSPDEQSLSSPRFTVYTGAMMEPSEELERAPPGSSGKSNAVAADANAAPPAAAATAVASTSAAPAAALNVNGELASQYDAAHCEAKVQRAAAATTAAESSTHTLVELPEQVAELQVEIAAEDAPPHFPAGTPASTSLSPMLQLPGVVLSTQEEQLGDDVLDSFVAGIERAAPITRQSGSFSPERRNERRPALPFR